MLRNTQIDICLYLSKISNYDDTKLKMCFHCSSSCPFIFVLHLYKKLISHEYLQILGICYKYVICIVCLHICILKSYCIGIYEMLYTDNSIDYIVYIDIHVICNKIAYIYISKYYTSYRI